MDDITAQFFSQHLTRYQIEKRLGAGGMARVYKGWDKNLDRAVAIKILHDHLASDPTFKERFEREAKFVASFNHPNIVQIYDFDVIERGQQSLYYMVMPYIPGKTLHDCLDELCAQDQRMSQDRVLQIMLNLTSAMAYAHGRGMIHRDVKPSNVLFNERGEAVLTDFGIARLAEGSNLTQDGFTMGTPAYMSPEQATGRPTDSRTDIYALGVMLYEMLTGKQPFENDGSLSILFKHLNEPVPAVSEHLPTRDANLDAVIFRAMAKHPDNRYQTALELAEDLKAAFSGQPIAEHPEPAMKTVLISDLITDQQAAQADVRSTRKQRSPGVILGVGLTVIATLVIVGLISQGMLFNPPAPTPPPTANITNTINAVESMTGDVESMTGALYFTSTFDADDPFNNYWQQDESGTRIRQITNDGFYRFSNLRPDTAVTTIFEPDYVYENVTITMEANLTEDSATASGYGIVFRYVDEDNYNVLAIDGQGRYSIWVRENGQWRELRDVTEKWTQNAAIRPIGQPNTLTVEVSDNHLTGYANGEKLVSIVDDTIASGNVGIYIGTTARQAAAIMVNSYQVSEAVPYIESMTGDQ